MAEAALKPEKDFSKQVDELLPKAEELAQVGLGIRWRLFQSGFADICVLVRSSRCH